MWFVNYGQIIGLGKFQDIKVKINKISKVHSELISDPRLTQSIRFGHVFEFFRLNGLICGGSGSTYKNTGLDVTGSNPDPSHIHPYLSLKRQLKRSGGSV